MGESTVEKGIFKTITKEKSEKLLKLDNEQKIKLNEMLHDKKYWTL